jgi:fructoselysine-6-P-deglycase FrlB-like protein
LAEAFASVGGRQLIAIGSGGSFVAAEFASMLHEAIFGELAKPLTPLEATATPATDAAVLLLSARGNNPDIIEAFRQLAVRGHPRIITLCARLQSPLGDRVRDSGHQSFDFAVPTGRDGYLATNSLIATLVLLYRAFVLGSRGIPVDAARTLASGGDSPEKWIPDWSRAERLTGRETLVVLAEGWGRVAGTDLESRFVEAALGNVSVTDYRNFAHGRHHWLNRRGDTSAVVSLETPESTEIASRTLAMLPAQTEMMRIQSAQRGPLGAIELVRASMALTLVASEARGIDPGRPTVAHFGRQLYRARSSVRRPTASEKWVGLKARALGLAPATSRRPIEDALSAYLDRIRSTTIRGLVVDYDGTLSATDFRSSGVSNDVASELNRLLGEGLQVGIATGRGQSAHQELRRALLPEYWPSVIVGLHNGNMLLELDHDVGPHDPPVAEVLRIAAMLVPLCELLGLRLEIRHRQISVHPEHAGSLDRLQAVIGEGLRRDASEMRVVRSSHSLDIVMPGVSKVAVVCAVAKRLALAADDDQILRIGDRGNYQGNDFELLQSGLSLSVDEVSADFFSCWNLSRAGTRSHQAMRSYLRSIVRGPAGLQLLPSLLSRVGEPR